MKRGGSSDETTGFLVIANRVGSQRIQCDLCAKVDVSFLHASSRDLQFVLDFSFQQNSTSIFVIVV